MSKHLGGIIGTVGCNYEISAWHSKFVEIHTFSTLSLQLKRIRRHSVPCFKKNQNAPRPSEHPPVKGKKLCSRLVAPIISIAVWCVFFVCVFSSHPFWTSSSLDVPAGVTQEEGHTGFLIHLPSAVRALIFVARRIQSFLSLVDREVEFCVLTN